MSLRSTTLQFLEGRRVVPPNKGMEPTSQRRNLLWNNALEEQARQDSTRLPEYAQACEGEEKRLAGMQKPRTRRGFSRPGRTRTCNRRFWSSVFFVPSCTI